MNQQELYIGLFFYIVFLFSTVCHEAAHALAAMVGGDLTAYHGGQVTLNPIPHIRREPFGLGILPLISLFLGGLGVFGYASAPFDPHWMIRYPKRAAWMAMAGPAANLVLSALGIGLLKLGILMGIFHLDPRVFAVWQLATSPNAVMDGVAVFLSVLFFENLLLGIWNLLPIPPMDGFSIVLFVLPAGKMEWFLRIRYELGMMFPLIMFGLSSMFFRFFMPVVGFVLETVL